MPNMLRHTVWCQKREYLTVRGARGCASPKRESIQVVAFFSTIQTVYPGVTSFDGLNVGAGDDEIAPLVTHRERGHFRRLTLAAA